ncbi:MAG: hypothetical protein KF832_18460 [Caldilineaceae bacterium]|nr:hypothetical protein [Caldilineaceae bacterium]
MAPTTLFDELTQPAGTVLEQAAQEANRRATSAVEPRHLLLALLDSEHQASQALSNAGVDRQALRATVAAQLPLGDPTRTKPMALSPETQQVIQRAYRAAVRDGQERIDVPHLWRSLLLLKDDSITPLLRQAGVIPAQIEQAMLATPALPGNRIEVDWRAQVRPSPIFWAIVALMIGCGAGLWFDSAGRWVGPLTMLFVLSGWIVSLCLHEFGHAFAAYLGGDTSVSKAGYLTLNPLRYTHPVLSIVFPVIFLLMGGIGLPGGAVYIRTGALRSVRWEALVSAAGPIGTLIFCIIISSPFYLDWQQWATAENWHFWPALAFLGFLQVTALLFNLLPLPPLDGFQLVATLFPPALRQRLLGLGNIGFFILLFLFTTNNPLTTAFWNFAFLTAARLQIPIQLVAVGYQQFSWWN